MKLSVSNIAWTSDEDERAYEIMRKYGFSGLEIAPTRIFPEQPYERLEAAAEWAEQLKSRYGFSISSMQSIWYGVQENVFGTEDERRRLTAYTKKAVDFAQTIGCRNLVFGCPRNRCRPEGADEKTAIAFFRELADYAALCHTVISIEANPPIYHTNYINTTLQALELAAIVDSPGLQVNLDAGTMIENEEPLSLLRGKIGRINHVHISEPGLRPLLRRPLHEELAALLREASYSGYVSIETGKKIETETTGAGQLSHLERACAWVKELFG